MSVNLFVICDSISKSFGSHTLFEKISVSINAGDRIGVIGPNGSGKSTFLKIIGNKESPDDGSISFKKDLKIAYVPQNSSYPDISIKNILINTLRENHPHLADFEIEVKTEILLSKVGFKNPDFSAKDLSGGWKKRVDIAKALILEPDLLLLDEPTNHLDLEGIEWLENLLKQEKLTYLVISHDRLFLSNVTNRVLEINKQFPKGLFAATGNYVDFMESKEEFLSGQLQYQKSLNSKVRYEQEWLKKSPKARTTKAVSRIKEAEKLIDELAGVKNRNKTSASGIDFTSSERMTEKLLVLKNVGKSIKDNLLFSKLDLNISPGMRFGIVGPNGSGKTTLLKILTGEVIPDVGTLKKADGLNIVYFDQHRSKIPDHLTLKEALATDGEYVKYKGSFIHVNSWCKRFLFDPARLKLPVSQLSGGEKARISIAKLMLQPADILLLDEPTNDLDIPTLEVLEENLMEFPGALGLITHDRSLMYNLCNTFIGLGVNGLAPIFADLDQWESYKKQNQTDIVDDLKKAKTAQSTKIDKPTTIKLSYKEKYELEQMENKILTLENEIASLNKEIENLTDATVIHKIYDNLSLLQHELEVTFLRWEELESKSRGN